MIITNVAQATCNSSKDSFDCVEYVRTYDGDTFFVNVVGVHSFFGDSMSVRVRGIDTGEVRAYPGRTHCEIEMAFRAKHEMAKVLKNTSVIELRNIEKGKYFRILADVYVDGEMLSEQMIFKRLAAEYFGGGRSGTDWCELRDRADELKRELGIK